MIAPATRAEKNPFGEWWRTVDHLLFALAVILMMAGLVLSLAASPAVAERIGIDAFHFALRHFFFLAPAFLILVATSFLDERAVRRTALVVFAIALLLMVAVLFIGSEVKGARRWLDVGPLGVQPSEFGKPALAVLTAWLFAEGERRPDLPAKSIAWILLALVIMLLVLQPDFGQTLLVVLMWAGIYFIQGMPWILMVAVVLLSAVGLVAAYSLVPHVARRLDRFFDPASGDTYQIDLSIGSFIQGGWFGVGPGEGTVKRLLPDSHTDFIFAVVAEEYGAVVCLVLASLFALLVLRGLAHSFRTLDMFKRLAIGGLVLLLGLQSTINFAVNLHLLPAKGMTLPFVSYGGSSLLASAFTMGLLLALTRRKAGLGMRTKASAPDRRPALDLA